MYVYQENALAESEKQISDLKAELAELKHAYKEEIAEHKKYEAKLRKITNFALFTAAAAIVLVILVAIWR